MNENESAKRVLDAAFVVHTKLGRDFLNQSMKLFWLMNCENAAWAVERQKPVGIQYDGLIFDEGFRADLVVSASVIVELKSVESLAPVHGKQLLTQLRLSGRKLGLLINFGEAYLKNGIKRVINGSLDEEVSF